MLSSTEQCGECRGPLGCCITPPQIGCFINRNLFFMVLEAGKSKIKVPADVESDERSFSGS
jgi:hypothetical protein